MDTLISLVQSYVIPEMLYKLGLKKYKTTFFARLDNKITDGNVIKDNVINNNICKDSLKELSNKSSRALLKLHCMREHPDMNSWSSVHLLNFGKIQEEGQSAGNLSILRELEGSSETTCEAIKFNDKFK